MFSRSQSIGFQHFLKRIAWTGNHRREFCWNFELVFTSLATTLIDFPGKALCQIGADRAWAEAKITLRVQSLI